MTNKLKSVKEQMEWKVHVPELLKEIAENSKSDVLAKPLQILGGILYKVGERASELNDPELNALMCRLAIYTISDPKSKDYDEVMVKEMLQYDKQK